MLAATAVYDATSFVVTTSRLCTYTFVPSLSIASSSLGDLVGLATANLFETTGPPSCAEYTSKSYSVLWSVIGDIAFVPIDISTTDSYSTSIYSITGSSTFNSGAFVEIATAKDGKIQTSGTISGIYSSPTAFVSIASGQCAATFCVAPTVCADSKSSRETAQVRRSPHQHPRRAP